MKDFLSETMKLEAKIQNNKLLQDYYMDKITWFQYKEQIGRINGYIKALLEECDVKPSFRSELESHDYPLSWWISQH